MREGALDYDPLLAAVHDVLMRARPTIDALNGAAGHLDRTQARLADEIAGRIARERIRDPRDLSGLTTLLETLSGIVADGYQTRVDYPEFGEPTPYRVLSDAARELELERQTIAQYRDALESLHMLRRAEILTLQMRAEDAA
ncbi:hypothetical protein ROJ8625_03617 [Roseivivax jejudonensis]|uniref:Uncharacterized protein n=1 Tax=Roseivivax jejudonensis TaxID=1529041 RepID=A0A1X7A3X6_9RHOB|nr:hypothetical protein [Roseivivax jejudonensis]SLN69492.1 hypothetical protein ROJ8625_03617 [Roseivivax jejudonensis]